MITLIKSGIVCLVSMFFIRNRIHLKKTDIIETTYSNQLVQENNMLQYVCSLTKPNVIEKYAVPIQNNQYKPAFQQRRKYAWCIFIWLHVANKRINHSFMSFPKYRSGFVQTCTHCRQDVEFRECCNWMYRTP